MNTTIDLLVDGEVVLSSNELSVIITAHELLDKGVAVKDLDEAMEISDKFFKEFQGYANIRDIAEFVANHLDDFRTRPFESVVVKFAKAQALKILNSIKEEIEL